MISGTRRMIACWATQISHRRMRMLKSNPINCTGKRLRIKSRTGFTILLTNGIATRIPKKASQDNTISTMSIHLNSSRKTNTGRAMISMVEYYKESHINQKKLSGSGEFFLRFFGLRSLLLDTVDDTECEKCGNEENQVFLSSSRWQLSGCGSCSYSA